MQTEFEKVLGKDEKILWQGGPSFKPFFAGGSVVTTIFALFWLAFVSIFVVTWFLSQTGAMRWAILAMPHVWISIVMLIGPPLYSLLVYKHTAYAVTNRRVIFQKGVIGRDFDFLDFDKITAASVNVGVFDKIFGGNTGSITLQTAGMSQANANGMMVPVMKGIQNINNPYEVYKYFEKVSYDIKTDIQYPNDLRPRTNTGYQAEYKAPAASSIINEVNHQEAK